jgi:ketosteroid isomerase-like protein
MFAAGDTRWFGHPPIQAPLTRSEALEFAARWVAAWNRRDVDAVLAHYVDDATFISPKAQLFVGVEILRQRG